MSGLFDPNADDDLQAAVDTVSDLQLAPLDLSKGYGWQGAGEASKGLLRPAAGVLRTGTVLGGLAPPLLFDKYVLGGDAQDRYYKTAVDDFAQGVVDTYTPDARTMGGASSTLHTVLNVGGTLPFLFASPELFLANSAVDPALDLTAQGVDANTATGVGLTNLGVNAVGFRLPAAWGDTLATRVLTGAGANTVLGIGADAASAGILDVSGYDEQALAYDWANPQNRTLDVLMGAAFGVKAHVDAPVDRKTRDAILTARNADSFTTRTMPGDPVEKGADIRHQQAMSRGIEQITAGEAVDVGALIRPGDFVLRPEVLPTTPGEIRGGNRPADVQQDFRSIAALHGAKITSMQRGVIARGAGTRSQHPRGTAADYRTKDKTPAQVEALMADLRAAGFEVIDERNGPEPHIHAELPPGGRTARDPGTDFDAQAATAAARAELDAMPELPDNVRASLAERYEQAAAIKPEFDANVRAIAELINTPHDPIIPGKLKGSARAAEKVLADYGGDASRLRDLVRATLVVDNVGQVQDAIAAAGVRFGNASKMRNTLSPEAMPTAPDGYRDVLMNFEVGGHTVELQVDLPTMMRAKKQAHGLYEQVRTIEATAAKEGRDTTEDEQAHMRALVTQQREIYDAAWEEALGAKGERPPATQARKSASVIKEPLWENAENANGRPPSASQAVQRAAGAGADETGTSSTSAKAVPAGKESGSDTGLSTGRNIAENEVPRDLEPSPEMAAVQGLADESPDLPIIVGYDADGAPIYRPISEALAEIMGEQADAIRESDAYLVGANCYLQRGGA